MFQLVSSRIVPLELSCSGAGGFVSFEGKVRNHAEGKSVSRLEYEACEELATSEGNKLVEEAIQRFDLLEAVVIHRTGILEIGETAVWIGTAAAHRREAFEACEWLIDQLKVRVPIWKREHFADGNSTWVGADPLPTRLPDQLFVSRQMKLSEIGAEGQAKLGQAKVLLVGAGGLGAGCLPYLAGAGIGTIGILDADLVAESNLHRQVIYNATEVGRQKAERAARFAKNLNPKLEAQAFAEMLTAGNVRRYVESFDLVIDGTDSLTTKFLLNAECRAQNKPFISASIHKFEGHLMSVLPGGPCLNCLFPEVPSSGCVGTCADEGVLGTVAGFFGLLQANLAIQILVGLGNSLSDELLMVDLRTYEMQKIRRAVRDGCIGCKGRMDSSVWEIASLEEAKSRFQEFCLIDIRDLDETPRLTDRHHSIPVSEFRINEVSLPAVLVCASGARSFQLTHQLREQGIANVVSSAGGIASLEVQRPHD